MSMGSLSIRLITNRCNHWWRNWRWQFTAFVARWCFVDDPPGWPVCKMPARNHFCFVITWKYGVVGYWGRQTPLVHDCIGRTITLEQVRSKYELSPFALIAIHVLLQAFLCLYPLALLPPVAAFTFFFQDYKPTHNRNQFCCIVGVAVRHLASLLGVILVVCSNHFIRKGMSTSNQFSCNVGP